MEKEEITGKEDPQKTGLKSPAGMTIAELIAEVLILREDLETERKNLERERECKARFFDLYQKTREKSDAFRQAIESLLAFAKN